MTNLTQSRTGTPVWTRVSALLDAVRQEWRRRRIYRATLRELRALSQRELDDLGISRTMISRLAAEAAWGKRN